MSQKEIAVIECDGPLCDESIADEDWPELHDRAKMEGWRIDATSDFCGGCK